MLFDATAARTVQVGVENATLRAIAEQILGVELPGPEFDRLGPVRPPPITDADEAYRPARSRSWVDPDGRGWRIWLEELSGRVRRAGRAKPYVLTFVYAHEAGESRRTHSVSLDEPLDPEALTDDELEELRLSAT